MEINYKNHIIQLQGSSNSEGRHCVYAVCIEDKTYPRKVRVCMTVLPKSTHADESWRYLEEMGMYMEYSRNIKKHGPNEEQAALLDSLLSQCKF